MAIHVTPIPRLTSFAAPSLTLGTANAAGSAETTIATDSTILTFDTTLPAAVGTAATGSATVATRRDHVHAGTTLASPSLTLGTANAAGSASTALATDSTLLAFDTTVPATVSTNATGSATVAARRDHVHTGLANVVQDTSPQLGGNLDGQNNDLTNIGGAGHDWTSTGLTITAANFEFGVKDSTNTGVHYVGSDGDIEFDNDESFTFTMPTGDCAGLFTITDINSEVTALFMVDHANVITKIAGDALFVTTDGGSGGAANIPVISGAGSRVTTVTNRRNTGTSVHLEILGRVASATAVA